MLKSVSRFLPIAIALWSTTALAAMPTAFTGTSERASTTAGRIYGAGNPNGETASGYFRYSTSSGTCSNSFGSRAPTSGGASLGSGTSVASYYVDFTGLAAGTTYYYCAVAENASGANFGVVHSFSFNGDAPSASTGSATSLTSSSATIGGSANPNGSSATGWFRYSTTSPGVCSDSFGTRVPSSGGTSLGAGSSSVSFSEALTGLQPSTTYYRCAIAQSSYGIGFGSVSSFTTLASAPTVSTSAVSSLGPTTATMNGSANPWGSAATGYFRMGTTDPGSTCLDTYGTRYPSSGGASLGSGQSSVTYSQVLTTLTPGTTYYYCAFATNSAGTTAGSTRSFTTPILAPTVSTAAISDLTDSTVTLNGTAYSNGADATAWFRYSDVNPGTCNDSFGTRAPAVNGTSIPTSSPTTAYSEAVSGLAPSTTYYACAVAANSIGKSYGSLVSFTTQALPVVTTSAATPVLSSTATLNGVVNPKGAATSAFFMYSTTNPGTCTLSSGMKTSTVAVGSGSSDVSVTVAISGLIATTTYYFCAGATNAYGTSFGPVQSFTTNARAPTLTGLAVNERAGDTALFVGTGVPNGAATVGWFRYRTTSPSPSNCVDSDTFGIRVPDQGGFALGAGVSATDFSTTVTGLLGGQSYYVCAFAANSFGSVLGTVYSFTSPRPPTVRTVDASPTRLTQVTLRGSVTTNSATSLAWFRVSTTNPGTCDDTFGERVPATGGVTIANDPVARSYSLDMPTINPLTTYYYCAIASNSAGTSFGDVLSFYIPNKPVVTTDDPVDVLAQSVTMQGTIIPNGASTAGSFRIGTTDPGTCTTSFGTYVPNPVFGSAPNLGSGLSAVTYTLATGGLLPGTTYYYCAAGNNVEGIVFGAVKSFTTQMAAPSVKTSSTTDIQLNGATLRANVNPYGADTEVWFRYSTTNPVICDDTFGTRMPPAGGLPAGDGKAQVTLSQPLTTLSNATTYYACAFASNAYGTSIGDVVSFTTPDIPIVSTGTWSDKMGTSVHLHGSVNPKGDATTVWFRMDTVDPGTCDDTFGFAALVNNGQPIAPSFVQNVFEAYPVGLAMGTTYYYCAIAQNTLGKVFGTIRSVTTGTPPVVETRGVKEIVTDRWQLIGAATTDLSGTGWFRLSTIQPVNCDDALGVRVPSDTTQSTNLSATTDPQQYGQITVTLTPATTYYYCAIASNGAGTAYGSIQSFRTTGPPTVTTVAASDFTSTSARLNGTVVSNDIATTGWFRYGTTSVTTCTDTYGTRFPTSGGSSIAAGSTPVAYSQTVTGLTAGTLYYVCAGAQNTRGTRYGAPTTFVLPTAATVTTSAATTVTTTGATLNGTVNPRGTDATGWFQYGTTNPGTCTASFGTKTPVAGVSLGSGTTSQSMAETLTGLESGTTYYYCVGATNAAGTFYGSALSFTTSGLPVVTSSAATSVTSTSATLNGTVNPSGLTGTAYFRWGTTPVATCDDTYGTRQPSTGGTALSANFTVVSTTQALSGLTGATTYYYCAAATNSQGTTFGDVLSFRTLAVPSVTTVAVADLTKSSATLRSTVNPNGASTTAYFRYSTTNPGLCNDTFGTRVPSTGGTAAGSGTTPVDVSRSLTGLSAGTTYYYCARATNAQGNVGGDVLSFRTPTLPTVTTGTTTAITSTTATLKSTVTPNGDTTTAWFRLSTTTGACTDSFGTRAPATDGSTVPVGASATDVEQPLSGLNPGTTYYTCAVASNVAGTVFGSVQSFTTPSLPSVTTSPVSLVKATTVTLNASASGNGSATTLWFRYDLSSPGACSDAFGTRFPATGGVSVGTSFTSANFTSSLTGLLPSTTYYVCALAQNAVGLSVGAVQTFTTSAAPVAVTDTATSVTATGAMLRGVVNSQGAATLGWFRYGPTDPGTCDDTFGTRAPTAGGTSFAATAPSTPFQQLISGLKPASTYFYCAIAENEAGRGTGSVQSFATASAAPAVTTLPATDLASDGARLAGSGTPNGVTTLGWFRYSAQNPGACDDLFGTRVPSVGGTPLGSGNAPAGFDQPLSGLLPGTTYYFCAIAENALGLTPGTVRSFTTNVAAPVARTNAATNVTSRAAKLTGAGTPNGTAGTGWFRFIAGSVSSCDTTFGTRVPSSGGVALGSGALAVSFEQSVLNLAPGTTYSYCAIVQTTVGVSLGNMQTFTTLGEAPTVVTSTASAIGPSSAVLEGSGSPNGDETIGWFRYDTANPGTCNDGFGVRVPAAGGTSLGSLGSTSFTQPAAPLTQGTTYYYCALASNAQGTAVGAIKSFTTPSAPTVKMSTTTAVRDTTATANGVVSSNGAATEVWFRFDTVSPGSCNDTYGQRLPASVGIDVGASAVQAPVSQALTGLAPGTTYYVCAVARNAAGTVFSTIETFRTLSPPTVVTGNATMLTGLTGRLNATVDPHGLASWAWFRVASTDPGTCRDNWGTQLPEAGFLDAGSGTSPGNVLIDVQGMVPEVTYYFCAIAENELGRAYGAVHSFRGDAPPPTVITKAATEISAHSVTLSGSANPTGTAAVGWFRYGSTNPGVCNDEFGTRVSAEGFTLGSGMAGVPFDVSVEGLAPGTTHYFCALASNNGGVAFGTLRNFTTDVAQPIVTTELAQVATDKSATLSGHGTSGGAEGTAGFRWGRGARDSCSDGAGELATSPTTLPGDAVDAPFTDTLRDLTPGTYYVCARLSTSAGVVFGEVTAFEVAEVARPVESGCACGSSTGGGWSFLPFALLVVLVRRRRREV